MGEIPLMTRNGSFVVNGTERVIVIAAAPLAGRVLRARPRQDPLLRQAALLRARDPLPRLVARLRVRPQGLPLFPRRPPPQDAGDDPAEGAGLQPRAHPRPSSSSSTPSTSTKKGIEFEVVPERMKGEIAKLRHRHQGRQGDRAEGQAHHREAHPRDGSRGHEEARRRARLPARPHARQEPGQHGDGRDRRQRQRGDHRGAAQEDRSRPAWRRCKTLYTNDLDQGPYISQTLRIDETRRPR